jgi:hypothetical protein
MIITGLLIFIALMMLCCVLLVMNECDYYEQQEYDAVLYSTSDISYYLEDDGHGFGQDHWDKPAEPGMLVTDARPWLAELDNDVLF